MVLFYHFAFVAISVALFGLGVGGIAAYYMPAVKDKESTWSQLGRFCTKNALLVVVTLLLVIDRPLYLEVTWLNALQLVVVYIVCALPFLSGSCRIAGDCENGQGCFSGLFLRPNRRGDRLPVARTTS